MPELGTCDRDLIQRALAGDAPSLETLAGVVRVRVYSYLRRVTLDEHKADDLTQDTLVAVLKSMGGFKQIDRFWPWVFTIATNSVRQLYRSQAVRRAIQMSSLDDAHVQLESRTDEEGSRDSSRRELGELTHRAMSRVSERDRMVLALRFYEDMPHAEIARVLGCSELRARVSFFRAKHALRQELKGLGIGASALAAALVAFGEMTLPSSASAAAVAVSSAAVSESVVLGLLSGKMKAAAAAVALVLTVTWFWNPASPVAGSGGADGATSVHFVHQSLSNETGGGGFPSSRSKGAYEQWYRFPEGPDGPFLFRMQRWNPQQTQKLCWWVQNADANYYVHSGEQRIYLSNARLYSSRYSTKVLPTDPPDFCRFVRDTEGPDSQALVDGNGVTYERDPATATLNRRIDTRFPNLGAFVTRYDYAPIDTKLFDAPTGLPVKDERDEMHKRGWTLFRVEGQLGGTPVQGVGRLPFIYREIKTHPAWLRLSIAGKPVAIDDGKRAATISRETGQVTARPGGSLFEGLSRPWTGFHTLDTIRRDAARHRMWFSTNVFDNDKEARVTIVDRTSPTYLLARYTIDLENDLLRQVEFWAGPDGDFQDRVGELMFTYLEDVREAGPEFTVPAAGELARTDARGGPTPLWPVQALIPAAAGRQDRPGSDRAGPLAKG
jgi:RNA polymerase sigma-70 factor (ECF subfamily)